MYSKGDLVEYYSGTHRDWLPATILNVDGSGRVIIDLKPNTWMSREEQASKIRPRGGHDDASAAPAPPMPVRGRTPSAVSGLERQNSNLHAPYPGSRAASPSVGGRNAPMRAPSPSRAASPRLGGGMRREPSNGALQRPPMSRDSPSLRAGGRNIAGI